MSDVMLYGILSMPYEMAMSDELSRFQFYKTVQLLLEKYSQQQAEIEALKLGDIKWSHAFDLAKIEIEALKAENKKAYAYIARLANKMGKAQEK